MEGMKKSIKAIQCHMIKNDKQSLEKQHQVCPKSSDTWCKYWNDKHNGTTTYSEDNRLPQVFATELYPIFKRLSNNELLTRCLKGLTQSQNEAINGILWSHCPKTKFCGARKVRIAVCKTIAVFNTGSASKAVLMKMCGIEPGRNTMKALRLQDKLRSSSAAQKVSKKYKEQRRKLRSQRKVKGDSTAYHPGNFGLTSQREVNMTSKGKKRKRKCTATNDVSQVKFVMPLFEVIGQPSLKSQVDIL